MDETRIEWAAVVDASGGVGRSLPVPVGGTAGDERDSELGRYATEAEADAALEAAYPGWEWRRGHVYAHPDY